MSLRRFHIYIPAIRRCLGSLSDLEFTPCRFSTRSIAECEFLETPYQKLERATCLFILLYSNVILPLFSILSFAALVLCTLRNNAELVSSELLLGRRGNCEINGLLSAPLERARVEW